MRVGELFAGYGGLGLAVSAVWPDAELAWYSDVCKFAKDGTAGHHEPHRGPCAIMTHHHPDVPNLGDVTKVDWSQVEPVDIITGGSPCQDLSTAGKRAGMTEGTRSNLWVAMREAIAVLRPGLVIWENVRGAYSAAADSDLEPCEGCMGDHQGEPVLRALGRVLGDLSELGYDAVWHGLRAADIGAPHGRFRVFVVAVDANADRGRFQQPDRGLRGVPVAHADRGTSAYGDDCGDRRSQHGRVLGEQDSQASRPGKSGGNPEPIGGARVWQDQVGPDPWGVYADAIRRWERVTRPAPNGLVNGALNVQFVEWMMGLPQGHVADVPGITRAEMLKALGNGVQPQQATAAIRYALSWLGAK